MALSLKQEYEKQYRETLELLRLLGRAAGVQCDLQVSAFRRTCELAVAYGKVASLPTYNTFPASTEAGKEKK